jgi:actin-related protein
MNKKLSTSIKNKHNQNLSLQEENKHLKKVNKKEKLDEIHNLKEQLEEATRHLTNRDNDFKVPID